MAEKCESRNQNNRDDVRMHSGWLRNATHTPTIIILYCEHVEYTRLPSFMRLGSYAGWCQDSSQDDSRMAKEQKNVNVKLILWIRCEERDESDALNTK